MPATHTQKHLAHAAGRMAARTGRTLAEACPYRPSVSGTQRVLTLWFVRGYRSAQPPGSAITFS